MPVNTCIQALRLKRFRLNNGLRTVQKNLAVCAERRLIISRARRVDIGQIMRLYDTMVEDITRMNSGQAVNSRHVVV